MKIGPYTLTRSQPVQAAQTPTAPREIGASGSQNLDGFLIESEYNPDLRGKRALQVFDRMLRSDDAVQEGAGHITAPILNGTRSIEPAGDQLEDLEVAAAAERAYGDWLQPGWGWQQHLDEALEFLFLGFSLFETSWHVVEDELEIDDPSVEPDPETGKREKRVLPRRQFLTFKRFDPRRPETIQKWNEQDGELVSVTQYTSKDGANWDEFEMPVENLLLLTCRRRGHEYTGRSLLRAAYKPWVFKEMIEKVAGIAVEKHGVGTWIAYTPAGRENDSAFIERCEAMLRDARSGAQAYMVAPFPKQAAGTESNGGLFEIVTPPGGIPDFTGLLEYFRGGIKGALLTRFSELGHGSVGARATGDTQSEVWYDALHSVARQIEDLHNEKIRQFVRANFQTLRFPKLKFTDIESRSLEEYALAVSRLATAIPELNDKPARRVIRKAVDFPEEELVPEETPADPGPNPPPDSGSQPDQTQIEEEA